MSSAQQVSCLPSSPVCCVWHQHSTVLAINLVWRSRHCLKLVQIILVISLFLVPPPDFWTFKPATESEIFKILSSCLNKQPDLDPILTWLSKECFSVLIFAITTLINLCLSSGNFHFTLKKSVVSPLLKTYLRHWK